MYPSFNYTKLTKNNSGNDNNNDDEDDNNTLKKKTSVKNYLTSFSKCFTWYLANIGLHNKSRKDALSEVHL